MKNCTDDKILNEKTGRCVKKDGKIGKEILSKSKSSPVKSSAIKSSVVKSSVVKSSPVKPYDSTLKLTGSSIEKIYSAAGVEMVDENSPIEYVRGFIIANINKWLNNLKNYKNIGLEQLKKIPETDCIIPNIKNINLILPEKRFNDLITEIVQNRFVITPEAKKVIQYCMEKKVIKHLRDRKEGSITFDKLLFANEIRKILSYINTLQDNEKIGMEDDAKEAINEFLKLFILSLIYKSFYIANNQDIINVLIKRKKNIEAGVIINTFKKITGGGNLHSMSLPVDIDISTKISNILKGIERDLSSNAISQISKITARVLFKLIVHLAHDAKSQVINLTGLRELIDKNAIIYNLFYSININV